MSNEGNFPPTPPASTEESGMRGIILTITESGRVNSQMMGSLNEAEFLGLGVYLTNVLMKDGILALSKNQIATVDYLQKLEPRLAEMCKTQEEEEECGKGCCSASSPSAVSLQSSENCQAVSEE